MAGGTTVHTYQMAKHFAALGHAPYVITAGHASAPAEEHGGIEVRRVRRPYTLLAALKAGRLRRELDVVHGHGTCAYGFMRLYDFPTVVKMHGTWLGEYERYRRMGQRTGFMRLYVRMDRYCARRADAVVAISRDVRQETLRYGVEEDRIRVIHNGIDALPFAEARPAELEFGRNGREDAMVIGYVGRLAPHKGVGALTRAFIELASRHEDVRLMVVGDGPEKARMMSMLGPLKDRAAFAGYVPHDEVPGYYAAADIMVYPTTYEPLGNVVLESMAAGRPLIASRTGGIPEIFSKDCGILVRPPEGDEPGELTGALERLVSSGSLRRRMGARGKEHVKRYTWTRVCKRTIEVMEGVLGR